MISMNMKYKTVGGRPVRILCIDRKDSQYPVIALIPGRLSDKEEFVYFFTKDGKHRDPDNTLVEVCPYEDFKQDDKVLVSHDGEKWFHRHFSRVVDGKPYAYVDGISSWTRKNHFESLTGDVEWEFCKKPD